MLTEISKQQTADEHTIYLHAAWCSVKIWRQRTKYSLTKLVQLYDSYCTQCMLTVFSACERCTCYWHMWSVRVFNWPIYNIKPITYLKSQWV